MKATIILEDAPENLIKELKGNRVLKQLGARFAVMKVRRRPKNKKKSGK